LVVGNIRENTIKELAEGDRAWNIIKGFYSGQRPEICRACTFYTPVNRTWLKSRALAKARLLASPQPARPQVLAKQ
jgi:hypothetical protein